MNDNFESIIRNTELADGQWKYLKRENDVRKAEIVEVRNYTVSETASLSEKLDSVKATAVGGVALAKNAMQAKWDMTTGQASVIHDMKASIRYQGQDYSAGMVIGAELKNGQVTSMIGFNAQQFAFYNPANGKMNLFMYMKNGQIFMNEAFINKTWLNEAVVTDKMQSDNYVPGKAGFVINAKTGNAEFNNATFRGTLDGVDGNFRGTVYAERIIGDVAVGGSYPSASAENTYSSSGGWTTVTSVITYTGGMPYDMTLVLPSVAATVENRFGAVPRPIKGTLRFSVRVGGVGQPSAAQWEGMNVMGSAYALIPKGHRNVRIEIEVGIRHTGPAHVMLREGPLMVFKSGSASFH